MKKSPKTEKIIDCALTLLKTQGDHGVTMRQVAQGCEMSLSNVQYYFKNKDELLKAMADRYFSRCLEEIQQIPPLSAEGDTRDALAPVLREFLNHGLEVSEMCRIFREYWAIATRNQAIEQYLVDYYQQMAATLAAMLQPVAASNDALERAVSTIIPFVEGYTLTAKALPLGIEETNRLFTALVAATLSADATQASGH